MIIHYNLFDNRVNWSYNSDMIEQAPLTIWPNSFGMVAPDQDINRMSTLDAPCLDNSFFIALWDRQRKIGELANLSTLEQIPLVIAWGLDFFSHFAPVAGVVPNIEFQSANLFHYHWLIAGSDTKELVFKTLRLVIHAKAPLWTKVMAPWLVDNELVKDIGNVAGVRFDTALGLRGYDIFSFGSVMPRRHQLSPDAIGITYLPPHLLSLLRQDVPNRPDERASQ